MIPDVEGTRSWEPSRKRVHKCFKGPKTTYTTIAISEKQSKRSKGLIFVIHWVPPGPTQEMELMGPGGEGPSRSSPPPLVSPAMVLFIMLPILHHTVQSARAADSGG